MALIIFIKGGSVVEIQLKQMTKKHLDDVVNLYIYSNPFTTKKAIRSWTKVGLEKFPDLNYVLLQGDEIVGAVSAIVKGRSIIINDIAIAEKHRNKGYGAKLIRHLLNIINEKYKNKKIKLWIHWENLSAMIFYIRFGFRVLKAEVFFDKKICKKREYIIWMVKEAQDIFSME